MGRYYDGDIQGKFWFGIQSSDDADFFGVEGQQPNYLEYEFGTDGIEDIEHGIAVCYGELGDNKERLDKFFDELKSGYNEDMIRKHWVEWYGVEYDDKKIEAMLKWYARLELGEQILNCVKENGECNFRAEL